jgi:hypothetical protein
MATDSDTRGKSSFRWWTGKDLLDHRPWEFVFEGVTLYDIVATDTGDFLKHFVIIRNCDTGEELTVSAHEALTFAGVKLPAKRADLDDETIRNELHQIVDILTGEELRDARRYLLYLHHLADPATRSMLEAPIDDEPLTEEELAAVEEGRRSLLEEEAITTEELRRQLGLCPKK